MLNLIMHSL